jgi:hypothetical protein
MERWDRDIFEPNSDRSVGWWLSNWRETKCIKTMRVLIQKTIHKPCSTVLDFVRSEISVSRNFKTEFLLQVHVARSASSFVIWLQFFFSPLRKSPDFLRKIRGRMIMQIPMQNSLSFQVTRPTWSRKNEYYCLKWLSNAAIWCTGWPKSNKNVPLFCFW